MSYDFNQLWSGFDSAGFFGELLIALTNTSMYTYEVAPLATLIEIIKKLNNLIDMPVGSGGTFVTGGSNGNLVGMLLARNKAIASGCKLENLCAFYSETAHYSLDTASMVLGLNRQQFIKIPTDHFHQMDTAALNQKIEEAKNLGKIPFFICGTAGRIVAGAFDPIQEIAQISKNNKCWLHIDAAHGGSVMFSSNSKHFLKGIELADSIVWDAHKTIGVPLVCSVLLVRDKDSLNFHKLNQEASDYLFHLEEKDSDLNLGTNSLQCGRRADCLKLWLIWNKYGSDGLGLRVDKLMGLAKYAKRKIMESPNLKLVFEPQYTNICFYYNWSGNSARSDKLHKNLKEVLYKTGLSMVNTARINSKVCIRLVLSNHETNESDIDIFFENILKVAKFLDKDM